MSRKKVVKDARVAGKPDDNFKGFIKHNLTAEEKDDFMGWLDKQDPTSFFLFAHEQVDSGYVISLKYDDYNETYQASMTCRNRAHDNFGFVLVARAPETGTAAFLLMYKHLVLLGGNWLAFHEREKEDRVWG